MLDILTTTLLDFPWWASVILIMLAGFVGRVLLPKLLERRSQRKAETIAAAERTIIEQARERLQAESEAASRGLNHDLLTPFLEWYYGTSVWRTDGQAFPAVVFPLPTLEKVTDAADVLRPWDLGKARATVEADWAPFDQEFVGLRKRAGREINNRQTFCLRSIFFNGERPVVESSLIGYYEDCLATCDALEWELLLAFAHHPPRSSAPAEFTRFSECHLPHRQAARSVCEAKGVSPYLAGAGRSAAIAVSTLTLAKKPDGSFVTFLGHRSAKTAAHPRLIHVAPSGMFQPIWDWQHPTDAMASPNYGQEWNLRNHILREVSEELFGREVDKALAAKPPETPDVIFGYPEIQYLNSLLDSGGANIFVTGVLVNLLNLRPEVTTVLVIYDPKWYECHSKGTEGLPLFGRNWEFLKDEELKAQDLPRFWHSPIRSSTGVDLSNELFSRIGGITPKHFVVPGAIALLLGLRAVTTID